MSNPISITPATRADIPVILSFIKGLAEYEKLSHAVSATEDSLRKTLFGEHRYAEVLIARLNDDPVGFALFFHNYSTFLAMPGIYLEDIFVLPEHRNKGAGKALLREIANIARRRKCGRFEWSVLDWNTPSIEFYDSLGAMRKEGWTVRRLYGESLEKLAAST